MRIVGGTKKGLTLKTPKSGDVRPTTEKIREALFNILPSVTDKTFLDLFAGTGSVGMEALSRGAGKTVFVEKNADMARLIKDCIRQLHFEEHTEVISLEMKRALVFLSNRHKNFDYIFIDPPYQRGLVEETLLRIRKTGLAGTETLIIVQHSKREPVNIEGEKFDMADCRSYGDSMLSFIKIN